MTTKNFGHGVMVAAGAATAATVIVLAMVWGSVSSSSSSSSSSSTSPKENATMTTAKEEKTKKKKTDSPALARNMLLDNDAFEIPPHLQREIYKNERRQSKRSMLAMKTRMYDNIRMLAPDGVVLCTISLKKAKWYVAKGIAEWSKLPPCLAVSESMSTAKESGSKDPRLEHPKETRQTNDDDDDDPTGGMIRLRFEPKNRSSADSSGRLYLQSDKRNQCVCCGSSEFYMRHYVVPYSYRTLLPSQYKTHLSHDIVLLCPECHVRAEQGRQARMTRLEQQVAGQGQRRRGGRGQHAKVWIRTDLARIRSFAMALSKRKDQLPADRIQQYNKAIRDYLHKQKASEEQDVESEPSEIASPEAAPLTPEELQVAMNVEYKVENPNYISGAELLVASLGQDPDKIEAFVQGWRRHFLQTMRPRFLPEGWSTTAPVACGGD